MRIDARVAGFDGGWRVWDVPACRPIETMVWCDDDFAQWGEYVQPYLLSADGTTVVTQTHQVERIHILPHKKLVLVNPVNEQFDEALVTMLAEIARLPARREQPQCTPP